VATAATLTISLLAAACSSGSGSGSSQATGRTAQAPLPQPSTRCGPPEVPAQVLRFQASDGVRIDGAMVGSGPAGVVLAHQSNSDLCGFWPYAVFLSQQGLRVLDIDLRCSGSSDCPDAEVAGRVANDVAGAAAELRRQGAGSVALVGASLGGMASLLAGAGARPPVDAVVSLSGPERVNDLDATAALARLTRPVLFVIARDDPYVTVDEVRSQYRATRSADKRIMVLGAPYTGSHGWDLLADGKGGWTPVAHQVASFVQAHARG
jgi:dienelactone hydrolase